MIIKIEKIVDSEKVDTIYLKATAVKTYKVGKNQLHIEPIGIDNPRGLDLYIPENDSGELTSYIVYIMENGKTIDKILHSLVIEVTED